MVLVEVGFLLPKKWIEGRYVTISLIIIVEATILSIVLKPHLVTILDAYTFRLFGFLIIELILIALLIVFLQVPILIVRINRIEKVVRRIADPLVTLVYVYIFVDLIGLLIVIIRNV